MRISKLIILYLVFTAMPRMLDELRAKESNEAGFLGAEFSLGTIVQYWRSFEHLEAFLFFSLFMRWHI